MNETKSRAGALWLMIAIAIASLWLAHLPVFNLILLPIQTFTTTLHELGHALACVATGGSVNGLTIVSDGQGHGGLTFTQGGIPWIIASAGYLGTTIFGCLFILIGKEPKRCKGLMMALGILFVAASLAFMSQTVFNGGAPAGQALTSVAIGLVMGLVLFVGGLKLGPEVAYFIVLFLAAQTSLNALTDIEFLTELSLGLHNTTAFSDATNMAKHTGLPAAFWSIVWGVISLVMLFFTIKFAYRTNSGGANDKTTP